MYSSQYQPDKKSETQLRMENALRKMDKAICGTSKHLMLMGPVRSKQVVQSLQDAFKKVKVAGELELQNNQSLREEFSRQSKKIAELERQVEEMQVELREEEKRCESQNGHLQLQLNELREKMQRRDDDIEYLLENVKNALEAAFEVYRQYGLDEIDNQF